MTVTRQRRHPILLALFMTFLILGTSHHCIFEDLLVAISQQCFAIQTPKHLPHHLGSNFKHKHDRSSSEHDSSKPHEHGQVHTLDLVYMGRSELNFLAQLTILPTTELNPASFDLTSQHLEPSTFLSKFSPLTTKKRPRVFDPIIKSLSAAPQAPPISA
jgi:hypothetical protein